MRIAERGGPVAAEQIECGQTEPSFQDAYQEALWLASWGWAVFPLDATKKPLCRWSRWRSRPQTDADITGMFFDRDRTPRPEVGGLAVVLGRASGGLAVRDFDTASGYRGWAERRPDLAAALPTVGTARGFHVYHRTTDPGRFVKLPDGDYRSDTGHCVVLPPSRHPSGINYRWVGRHPGSLADFPVLSLEQAGFLQGYGRPTWAEAADPGKSPEQSQERQSKTKNALCATSGPHAPLDGTLWTLPVPIREAVLRSQPLRVGERNDKLTMLVRRLKDIAPGVTADYWRTAYTAWWVMARDVIRTQPWEPSWKEFCRKWKEITVPVSQSIPRRAMAAAVKRADGAANDALVLAVCRATASVTGGPFWLAGRTAATEAGIPHRTAARCLDRLVAAGSLILLAKGRRSKTQRLASLYRLPPETGADVAVGKAA